MKTSFHTYCRNFVKQHHTLIENFSYVSLLQVFLMIAPLITYPYLVRVLGMELYGWVLTAQMLASYFSLLIDFGSNSVCAKHVALAKNDPTKLSEIVCSVFYVRFVLACIGLMFYTIIVYCVVSYRAHALLFMLTYGMTLNELLFPRYFYQGIEKMKLIAITNVVIKLIFIALIFVVVHSPADYIFVPIFYTIGYGVAGVIAMWFIFHKMHIHVSRPDWNAMKYYIKDSVSIFATDVVCTIKDKINYLLVQRFIGSSSVVVYDLALKLNSIMSQPYTIIKTVTFPRCAQSRDMKKIKRMILVTLLVTMICVALLNAFLPWIVAFFTGTSNIDILPIRLLSLAPIMLSVSVPIASNVCIALGYNKYVFYSIIVTTIVYLACLSAYLFSGQLNSIYSFVYLALISYLTELLYRIHVYRKVSIQEKQSITNK